MTRSAQRQRCADRASCRTGPAAQHVSARPESWPEETHGKNVAGRLLGFLVEDVDAEFDRLSSAGLEVVMPLVTEPWGQRRFQVTGPDGLLVEVLQRLAPIRKGWPTTCDRSGIEKQTPSAPDRLGRMDVKLHTAFWRSTITTRRSRSIAGWPSEVTT